MLAIVLVGSAAAQSVNVNFGDAATSMPSSTYAAAGAAGTWNTVTGISGMTFDLVAVDGTPGITMSQSPTTTLLATGDPALSGDDATLLNTGLITTGAETCLMFNGMQPGMYEVLIYAWTPNAPGVLSRTRQDEAPSTIDVGGAWTGAFAVGVTHARYVVTVGSNGQLPAHSGLAPSQPSAVLNGVQIRPLSSSSPDAGVVVGGPDAGGNAGGDDAATGPAPRHGGGCASTGGAGWPVAIAFVILARRRRRSR